MNAPTDTVNIVIAGLGGQGVVTASDIVAEAAFLHGYDVKKSELHGMSQRGGSVSSDVRFGRQVFSPMVPPGEARFLIVTDPEQVQNNLTRLHPGGLLIEPSRFPGLRLANRRAMNVALLGALSGELDIPESAWLEALERHVRPVHLAANLAAFQDGRAAFPLPLGELP